MATSLFQGSHSDLPFDRRAAVRHLKKADAKLAAVIDAVGPFTLTLEGGQTPFEALAESIVFQQLAGKAAATILSRVVALFAPKKFPTPEDILLTPDEKLRSAGLSGSKTMAVKDLAKKTLDGIVPELADLHAMEEEAIIERLTQVRGIGRWTVEMMLMFRLGRPDVLPVTDYGVRKGFQKVFRTRDLPDPKRMLAQAESWRPYRSVAAWYLWRVLDLEKDERGGRVAAKAAVKKGASASSRARASKKPRARVSRKSSRGPASSRKRRR